MRLLFVADGRSPIALNWMRYFVERGDEVHLATTFACDPPIPIKQVSFIPVAFSSTKSRNDSPAAASARFLKFRVRLRQWLGPLTIPLASHRLRKLIRAAKPDLVHAMRIPYEGMLAAGAATGAPLVISVWGNDFTLHAPSTPYMKRATRWALESAAGIHTDCVRDLRLAREWGMFEDTFTLVAPGNGGIRSDVFYPPSDPPVEPVVFNPRGFRAYVRNDTFFKSIPLVLAQRPGTKFVCAGMQGEPQAIRWVHELGLKDSVVLLPAMPHEKMADVFRSAQITVSPSVHDGTPNSLLEGMACGCFPVAGDLESIREWITQGRNGLLVDAADPGTITESVLTALDRPDLRAEAANLNSQIISARADYTRNMNLATEFYGKVLFNA